MNQSNRTNKEAWVPGRRGGLACLQIIEYECGINVSAEDDKITAAQLDKALNKLYPRHTFYAHQRDGYIYAQADVVNDRLESPPNRQRT